MKSRITFNHPVLKGRRIELRQRETDAEAKLWYRLRNKALQGYKFWRQFSVGPFILDFYCPSKRLAIELDGSQHMEAQAEVYDRERSNYLASKNIKVLRFWNSQVLKEMDEVLEVILAELKAG